MKSLIKDIVVFIAAVVAELYVFFQIPYLEMTHGHGDGFVILIPVFLTPVIGLILGLLAERRFVFSLPVLVAIISMMMLYTLCKEVLIGYLLIFTFGTLLGLGIGLGIRTLIIGCVEEIREKKSK